MPGMTAACAPRPEAAALPPPPSPLPAPPLPRWTGSGPVPAAMRGGALMLGNFDGLHRGHRSLLALARKAAEGREGPGPVGAPLCAPIGAMCAEPHPRAFFSPQTPPFRLACGAARDLIFAEAGLSMLYAPRFDRAFAALAPETFVEKILIGRLAVRALIFGEDFRFGARRAGDADLLLRLGARHGIETIAAPEIRAEGARISSTRIREALREGDLSSAEALLGRPWRTGIARLAPETVLFERDQLLPPPGLRPADALDASGAVLAETVIALGEGREARCATPPGTAVLRWR